ncbi:putative cytochrome P450 hydroxylase [[Actinomadura] parvosata subsp. kistnae]|uniref:cytochrome P450 n=1 Tax=[Actinomadura] parvosata TaxID=1955412 RepID=UPI000D2B2013|nr:putative cytochrome P450 hydroxylase [Actinomadura parvosata subsp. kistnae]
MSEDFPMPRTCPFDPPPRYAELREEAPVIRVSVPGGRSAWLVTGHANVRATLTDPHVSSDRTHPAFPLVMPGFGENLKGSILSMDPPEHNRHRRMVTPEFTVRRVQGLRPRIQEIVDERIDELLAGPRPADLVQALSLPVPSLVICELLGVPYSERDFFHTRTAEIVSKSTTAERRMAAMGEVRKFLHELVTHKQGDPGEDLLSRLVVKYQEAGLFDHQMMSAMALTLLIAGHETTANMISLGTVALLENPDQLTELRDDPSLMPGTVEELLRYFTIAETATSRVATQDIEVDGVLIRAGEGFIAAGASANRDPRVFADPDTLDIRRSARGHLAFGYGVHQCLGQNLARLELEIVYTTLFRRLPGLRLAVPFDELPFKHDANVYGLHSLPVTW